MYYSSDVFFFHVYFTIGTWVVHVLLWVMIFGQSKLQLKLFYLIYGMMDRVGSTCTTSRSFFVFKAIFTFLADYAKMMVVCMYSSEFWPVAIYINLIYGMLDRTGSRCTTPHISLYLETISKFQNLGSTYTPLKSDPGLVKFTVKIILVYLWTAG